VVNDELSEMIREVASKPNVRHRLNMPHLSDREMLILFQYGSRKLTALFKRDPLYRLAMELLKQQGDELQKHEDNKMWQDPKNRNGQTKLQILEDEIRKLKASFKLAL
jgi:hypothetical protein